jgi:lysozyme
MTKENPTWDDFLQHLRKHEGYRSTVYLDTMNHWTIGYGRKVSGDKGLTRDEAEFLLSNDAKEASSHMLANVALPDNVNQARRYALTAMTFQLGIGTFMKFKRMIAAVERGDWEKAAAEALDSKWADQTPARAHHVAEILRTGIWTDQ